MKKIIIVLMTVFVICGYASSAFAMLLNILPNEPEFPGTLPLGASHDVEATKGAEGWYNANLYATSDVILTYEYLGYEAGWINTFMVDGSEVFWNKDFGGNSASITGAIAASSATAGSLLDFAFKILAGGNAGFGVENGSNVDPFGVPNVIDNGYGHPNFFLGYADAYQNSAYIALDDGGGPWLNTDLDDDNHDDLVVKVTAKVVPEPSTVFLLGSGLFGLGAFRKKFKK